MLDRYIETVEYQIGVLAANLPTSLSSYAILLGVLSCLRPALVEPVQGSQIARSARLLVQRLFVLLAQKEDTHGEGALIYIGGQHGFEVVHRLYKP